MALRAATISLCLALSLAVASTGVARSEEAREAAGRIGVVELFTSQGCSSCPPADEILGELSRRPDILALSYNIDYWDYLGWKDTLADPDHTVRQKAYAHARGDRAVYTPQAVVNGMKHVVGSDRAGLEKTLAKTGAKLSRKAVGLTVVRAGDDYTVTVGKGRPGSRPAVLWLVEFEEAKTVEIARGENHGRTNTYFNVVRSIAPIGTWTGEAMTVIVPAPSDAAVRCAILLQEGDPAAPGPILAATRF